METKISLITLSLLKLSDSKWESPPFHHTAQGLAEVVKNELLSIGGYVVDSHYKHLSYKNSATHVQKERECVSNLKDVNGCYFPG